MKNKKISKTQREVLEVLVTHGFLIEKISHHTKNRTIFLYIDDNQPCRDIQPSVRTFDVLQRRNLIEFVSKSEDKYADDLRWEISNEGIHALLTEMSL